MAVRKKIFAYVGVNNPERSYTVRFIQESVALLREKMDVELSLYTNRELPMENCQGCLSCFIYGKCILDSRDGLNRIKQEMQNTDFIILGSPVYLHNVSGYMKTFIDRLSYWSHIFALRNKNGLVIATADCSGTYEVNEYLNKALTCFGCSVVGKIELKSCYGINEELYRICAAKIYTGLIKDAKSNEVLEERFHATKQLMIYRENRKVDDEMGSELRYWKETGMLYAGSFSEVLEKGGWKNVC